jgi:SPP1 gp7 family putative phage head morphogenesis protein
MELLYKAPSCCTTDHHLPDLGKTMELGFTDTLRSLFERITKAVFKGDLKAGEIDEDWFKHTSKELTDAVETGYDVPDEKMLAFLKDNVAIFSVAKTHKELRELTDLLTDGERVLPFSEFKDKAMGLFQISEDRLRSEYNHALGSAQMASKWSRIEEDKDALPMLVYRTVGDTHVRQEHAALDGIQRPVDDEFWDTHYPPNAWGCRCDVDQVATGKATNLENKNLPKNPTIFRNNVGKTGIAFPDSHPYFDSLEYKEAQKIASTLSNQSKEMEKLKGKYTVIPSKKGRLELNEFADPIDKKRNIEVGKAIADKLDIDLKIRPHLEIDEFKNPEFLIRNEYLADRKSISGKNGITNGFNDAKEQMMHPSVNPEKKPYIVIFDLDKFDFDSLEVLENGLRSKISKTRGNHVHSVIFHKSGRCCEITREAILKNDFSALAKIQKTPA